LAEWVKYAAKGLLEELGIKSLEEIANASSEVIIQLHANTRIWMEVDRQLEEAGLPPVRDLSDAEREEVRRQLSEKRQATRETRSNRRQKRREDLLQDVKDLIAKDLPVTSLEELAAKYRLTKYEALDVLKPAGPIPGWHLKDMTLSWRIYQEVAGYLARGVHVPSRQELAQQYGAEPGSVSQAVESLGRIPGWTYKEGKSKAEGIRDAIQLCLDSKIGVPSPEDLAERFETTPQVVRNVAAKKIKKFDGWPRKNRA